MIRRSLQPTTFYVSTIIVFLDNILFVPVILIAYAVMLKSEPRMPLSVTNEQTRTINYSHISLV